RDRNVTGVQTCALPISSTVWYRMLTDPSTGRVLDHVAHRYEPDRATRIAVATKWQTCTAPGCARPARHCELDHGVPFDHRNPERSEERRVGKAWRPRAA